MINDIIKKIELEIKKIEDKAATIEYTDCEKKKITKEWDKLRFHKMLLEWKRDGLFK